MAGSVHPTRFCVKTPSHESDETRPARHSPRVRENGGKLVSCVWETVAGTHLACHSLRRVWRAVSEARMAVTMAFRCPTGTPSLRTSWSTPFV